MICENITVGTRVDKREEQENEPTIKSMCWNLKNTLAAKLYERVQAFQSTSLTGTAFSLPKPRPTKHLLTACTSKSDKAKLGEELLRKSSTDDSVLIADSKKACKVLEQLVLFEDQAFALKLVDDTKLSELRRLSRHLLADAVKEEELFKFAHVETVVIAVAMTAASLAGMSPKKAFGVLEHICGHKIKLAKLRKSKGYELMKAIGFRLWDVY